MVSLGEIMYNLLKNPSLRAVNKSDVVNHLKDFINLVGAPGLHEDKNITLDIYDFRAQVPTDFINTTVVRKIIINSEEPRPITMGHNTDQFFNTYKAQSDNGSTIDLLYTFKVVGDFIYVDFKEGQIELAYKAFRVDEEGLPLINAGTAFRIAAEWYIKKQYYMVLWEQGLLPDKVLQYTDQQYAWHVGQAHSELNIPDPIEAEAIGNAIVRLIPLIDNRESNYKYDSQKERLINHAPFR